MTMRGPEISTGLSGDFVTDLLDHSQPVAREPQASGELQPSGHGTTTAHHEAFDAHVARDGTVKFEDHTGVAHDILNPDDWIMRRHGIDPYAATKLHWLDRTRDERARIGLEFRKDQLAHSAQLMKKNLDWMWSATSDPAERKQALFELWDECAETGDNDLVQGGAAARAYLVGFIRTRLPEGTTGAFTTDELARFNAAKKSQATFAPY